MQIGLGIGIPFNRGQNWNLMFGPAGIFANNASTGVWYDPSDINVNWRRNLLTYTEQFDNSVWSKSNSAVGANAVVAPDGTLTADKLVENTANADHRVSLVFTATLGITYTTSVFLKAGDRTQATLYSNLQGGTKTARINLLNGEVVSSMPNVPTVSNVGNGWYRVSYTQTSDTTSAIALYVVLVNGSGQEAYTGDGTSGIYLWGAQVEVGSTASTYQKITDGIQDYYTYQPQPVMFQDAAGTTPVTAVEQPVGLMLDKSKGLVLGSELVTNGDFSNGTTGWVASAGTISAVSGEMIITNSGVSYGTGYQTITTVIGKTYKVTLNAYAGTASTVYAAAKNALLTNPDLATVSTTSKTSFNLSFVFTAIGTSTLIVCVNSNQGNATGYFDNISVRELPGNHAYQTTSTSRPVLSARVNLLTKTEDFSDAAWVKSAGATITGDATAAPNGANTADLLICSAGSDWVRQATSIPATAVRYTYSIYAKANANTSFSVTEAGATASSASFTLSGAGVSSVVNNGGSVVSTITSVGGGWYLCTFSYTTNGAQTTLFLNNYAPSAYIWGADLRVANDGVGLPAYQRVNTATDYDTVGFPTYLRCDGVDDGMQTNSIDFTYTDKMAVFAGVRKIGTGSTQMIYELSTDGGANNGGFYLAGEFPTTGKYEFVSRGTSTALADSAASYASPITNVLTGIGNISGDQAILRINGTQSAISATDQGTGNYGNYPLYLFRRGGTSLPFNGRLYQLIVAGGINLTFNQEDNNAYLEEDFDTILLENTDQVNQNQLEMLDRFVNSKTKAY